MNRRRFLRGLGLCAGAAATGAAPLSALLHDVRPSQALASQGSVVTTCNMCFLGCSVVARQEEGRVVSLRGNPDSPVNRRRLCAKGHAGIAKAVHPDRITTPLIRQGPRGSGRFRRASWPEAIARVAGDLKAAKRDHGPESIALWQNVNMDRPDIFNVSSMLSARRTSWAMNRHETPACSSVPAPWWGRWTPCTTSRTPSVCSSSA